MENIKEIKYNHYTAKINLSRGANCISLRNEKYKANILREPDYSKDLDNPYLYGMPILYPVNRISGGRFEFEGREYVFPINEPDTNCHLHGELHCMPFGIVEESENFVKCVYDKPYLDFPHRFKTEICYTLSDEGLEQITKITNLSNENMPNFLGFHTTFNIPFLKGTKPENIRVFAQVGDEIERNMKVYLPTGKILESDEITHKFNSRDFIPFEKIISRHYRADKDGAIELYDLEKNIKLIYENDKKFTWRLLYNGNADEYICLEPQTCMANCQNVAFDREYAGFDYIEPHSSKEYVSRIYIKESEM